MGAVIPAVFVRARVEFDTLLDPDFVVPSTTEEVRCIDDSAMVTDAEVVERMRREIHRARRMQNASCVLTFLQKAGTTLLDPDFDPWAVGAPASQGFVDHRPIEPSAIQMMFANTLESVRGILKDNRTRPLSVFWVHQTTSVPKDEMLLNLWFYLSFDGHLVEPKVSRQEDGFEVSLIVND